MTTPATAKRVAKLRRDLRAAGLRATAPRLAVLNLLRHSRSPLSHREVAARLHSRGWDRATFYRNLVDLAAAGLARRRDLGDRVGRFEATGQAVAHRHPHFVCRDCGAVSCLAHVNVRIEPSGRRATVLRAGELEVVLKGRCDRCRQDSRKEDR